MSPLSVPTLPDIEGMDTFEGGACHTFWWPRKPEPLEGKRAGIIVCCLERTGYESVNKHGEVKN